MACLIDTGILLRSFDATCAEYGVIRQALRTLWSRQERLIVALQNLAEFWNVSTRPVDKNGYGLTVERVSKRLVRIGRVCDAVTEDDDSIVTLNSQDFRRYNGITAVTPGEI